MITTVKDFIASVKMMRTAQKLREKTGSPRSKKYAEELEKEVDAAVETALEEKNCGKKLSTAEKIEQAYIRG